MTLKSLKAFNIPDKIVKKVLKVRGGVNSYSIMDVLEIINESSTDFEPQILTTNQYKSININFCINKLLNVILLCTPGYYMNLNFGVFYYFITFF